MKIDHNWHKMMYTAEKITGKIIFVDIDQTICYMNSAYMQDELDYNYSRPIQKYIDLVNKLYQNNKIILFSARGITTGRDWKEFTERQLQRWNVKYHELKFEKPNYTIMIDDKCVNNFDDFLKYAETNF